MVFFPIEHSICYILGMVGPVDVKEMSQLDATLTWRVPLSLWLWIFKVKLYLGNRTSRSNLELL